VKDFDKSTDGSGYIFCDDLNLHKSVGMLKLRVPTKMTSKRISQANFTCLYASTVLEAYSYKISFHKFLLFLMKLSFPISTFNAHTYVFAKFAKYLHENMQKTLRTTQNLFNNWENQSQAIRKQFFFLCEVVASKVWCYIRTTITSKNRHHVICGLAHGDDQNFSKIVIIKEINHLTLCGCVR